MTDDAGLYARAFAAPPASDESGDDEEDLLQCPFSKSFTTTAGGARAAPSATAARSNLSPKRTHTTDEAKHAARPHSQPVQILAGGEILWDVAPRAISYRPPVPRNFLKSGTPLQRAVAFFFFFSFCKFVPNSFRRGC